MIHHEHSIFIPPHRAVYIDIAKVASSSIKATLAAVLDLQGAEGNPHLIDFPRPPLANVDAQRLYPDLYTFAFVRNPWDRLVSCYRDKIGGEVADFTSFAESGVAHCLARFDAFSANMSFDDFVHAVSTIPDDEADEHFRSQADYVCNARGEVAVDFIGRYEQLDQDFALVADKIGLSPELHLPRLQAAPKVGHNSFYTPTTRKLVEQRYCRDIELFGY